MDPTNSHAIAFFFSSKLLAVIPDHKFLRRLEKRRA
jgi:hypothetical protein